MKRILLIIAVFALAGAALAQCDFIDISAGSEHTFAL